MRKKHIAAFTVVLGFAASAALLRPRESTAGGAWMNPCSDAAKIAKGFAIAPVPLSYESKDRALVGLGSYIVNAQGGCNDCHTYPPYAEGHDPFEGGDGQINAAGYLAGGTPFGPEVVSANLTPDAQGRPGGLTYAEFESAIRTGRDPDDPDEILQVMPWPVYRHMTDCDLRAVYAYLSAIPHREGPAGGEGEGGSSGAGGSGEGGGGTGGSGEGGSGTGGSGTGGVGGGIDSGSTCDEKPAATSLGGHGDRR